MRLQEADHFLVGAEGVKLAAAPGRRLRSGRFCREQADRSRAERLQPQPHAAFPSLRQSAQSPGRTATSPGVAQIRLNSRKIGGVSPSFFTS